MTVFIYGIIYSSKINIYIYIYIYFFFSISAYGIWGEKVRIQVSKREFHTYTHSD